jgi:hypothetical protein
MHSVMGDIVRRRLMAVPNVLIIPGWGNSGLGHWQTVWTEELPNASELNSGAAGDLNTGRGEAMRRAGKIKILFILGFGQIVRDRAESRKLYGESLGIRFKEESVFAYRGAQRRKN